MSRNIVELEKVLNHLVFLFLQHALFSTRGNHCHHFFSADSWCGIVGDESCEFLNQPNNRESDVNKELNDGRCRYCQRTPVIGTDGLGDDFTEHEDAERENTRDDTNACTGKKFCSLSTHKGGTHGVGYRVDNQNSRNGTVDVGLEFLQTRSTFSTLLFQGVDKRNRS